jgi:transketolase
VKETVMDEYLEIVKEAFIDELFKISADLTADARDDLKTKSFAIPKGRHYPIEDRAHAANALARVDQNGSPKEKSQVYSAVAKKYPGLAAKSSVPAVKAKVAHSAGEYTRAAMHGINEELPTALGAMAGLAGAKMIELKTGKKINPIAASGIGYGIGGLADAALRRGH